MSLEEKAFMKKVYSDIVPFIFSIEHIKIDWFNLING